MKVYADGASVPQKITPKPTPGPKSSAHFSFDGNHADAMAGVKPGKKVRMVVHGKLRSSSHHDNEDGSRSGSSHVEVHKVEMRGRRSRIKPLSDRIAERQKAKV